MTRVLLMLILPICLHCRLINYMLYDICKMNLQICCRIIMQLNVRCKYVIIEDLRTIEAHQDKTTLLKRSDMLSWHRAYSS